MKKLTWFLAGVLSSALIIGGIAYFIIKTKVVPDEVKDETTQEVLIDKKINRISLDEYDTISKGFSKKTLVTFWTNDCKPCLEEIPMLLNYTKERNIDLIFVNLDSQSSTQDKDLIKRINNLKLENTYQLVGSKDTSDPINLEILASFLESKKIEIDTLTLPLNIVYQNGTLHSAFGTANINNLYFEKLNEYLK